MQRLTAAPRDHLTEAQVLWLLQGSPSIATSYGAELLDANLNATGSVGLLGGSVRRSAYANIHGTCELELDTALDWGNQLVRPWMELSDGTIKARWHLGVYSLATPTHQYGQRPRTHQVQGYDRIYLMAREIGATHVAPAGAGVLNEVRRIVELAGLSGVLLDDTKSAITLANPMIWPLIRQVSPDVAPHDLTKNERESGLENATTYLRVANDLLFSIGYRGLYADPANGVFRSEPYVNPSRRGIEHLFDFDHPLNNIVGQERFVEEDLFKAPNHWVFVRQNMPGNPPVEPTEANGGVYIVDRTAGDARTLKWSTQISLDVADYDSLVVQGDNHVEREQRIKSRLTVTTAPFPAAGHADVYRYRDSEMDRDVKVHEMSWDLNLDGGDMTRVWEVVG